MIKTLGLRIHVSHRNSKLRHVLNKKVKEDKCKLKNCRINNDLCLIKGTVYKIKCIKCGATYIGSSWRPLHTRFKEHMNQRASVVNMHMIRCGGLLAVEILEKDANIQRMRIKEAILIKKDKPTLIFSLLFMLRMAVQLPKLILDCLSKKEFFTQLAFVYYFG